VEYLWGGETLAPLSHQDAFYYFALEDATPASAVVSGLQVHNIANLRSAYHL